MTVSYFVRYEGVTSEALLRHYRERHVPILARWPGIRRIVLHSAASVYDPLPVNPGSTGLLAQLEFDSQADLERALQSAQRAEARRDFETFPPFEGKVVHQMMVSDEAWRKP